MAEAIVLPPPFFVFSPFADNCTRALGKSTSWGIRNVIVRRLELNFFGSTFARKIEEYYGEFKEIVLIVCGTHPCLTLVERGLKEEFFVSGVDYCLLYVRGVGDTLHVIKVLKIKVTSLESAYGSQHKNSSRSSNLYIYSFLVTFLFFHVFPCPRTKDTTHDTHPSNRMIQQVLLVVLPTN